MKQLITIAFLFFACTQINAQTNTNKKLPVRVGVVGLVHAHVHGILGRKNKDGIDIVGIAEPNKQLAEAYSKRYGYSMSIVYNTIEEMVEKTKPEAVFDYNSIYDHLKTVEYCAPRGIHVMVEKPMAVSVEAAEKMEALARKNNIYLLTNYETTWYGSNKKAAEIINDSNYIGPLTKLVFHTGHQGPIEIGCNPEFLEWLTDPKLNGAGALTDFGCYGSDITTWLMKGEHPITVSAVTQHFKPSLYPKVEDEATIILTYPKTQVIIEASWNWPYSRKDMEVYGKDGYVICLDNDHMLLMKNGKRLQDTITAPPLLTGQQDPFIYFANVIRGNIKVNEFDLSSLSTNVIVVKILDAAKESARTGKTIVWNDYYK